MSNKTIENRGALKSYAKIIRTYPFEKMQTADLVAYFRLLDALEHPLKLAPIAEVLLDRSPPRAIEAKARRILMRAYTITRPKKAIPLLKDYASSSDLATAVEAKVELMELYLHKLGNFDKLRELAEGHILANSDKSMIARLARVKLGDLHLMKGEVQKAEKIYRKVQDIAYADMDRREAAVLQGGYAETVRSLIYQSRFRAARKKLIQWEANFPVSKIEGDFILTSVNYWQTLGDAKRALDQMQALLRVNPLTAYLPEIEYRMANAYRDLGKTEKAIKLYRKVAKEYPRNDVSSKARAALSALR
jgi:tetratricopeptide (TPR) repeat protein